VLEVVKDDTPTITCFRPWRGLLTEITARATNPSAEVPAGGRQICVEDPSRAHAAGTGVDVAEASRGLRERGWLRIDLGELGRRRAVEPAGRIDDAGPYR
jgi:hypothetical protein